MAGRLDGKVAIITGGASGIGRDTVLRFVQEGASVVMADRNRVGGEETRHLAQALGPDVIFVPVDVSKPDQVQAMVEAATARFGRLDVLVNAAAVLIRTPPLAEIDERHWDLIMEANLKGLFLCCKHSIPAMLKSGGGSIVNISSVSGLRGQGYSLPYAVSKAGVIHLTMVAANQYTALGIRVNVVAPGPVDTPQLRGSTASAEAFKEREAQHPMGRVATPREIADAILFLASDEASFISGSTLLVDGGTTAVLS